MVWSYRQVTDNNYRFFGGMDHALFDEAMVSFVRPRPGADLTAEAVHDHCRSIAACKRPQHVEIWPADREFPLTRSTKVDTMQLIEAASTILERLIGRGHNYGDASRAVRHRIGRVHST